jgi:serine/threonine-protein kinase
VRSETIEGRRWIGRVLRDKWRIDARISRGGVGTVYAATHKNNGSRAAIKVLHPEFSRDADTRSRFLQEGYAANQVNHPGVVRILDDDTSEDGHAYLVMELLEGELLETRRIRKGGRLPLPDVYEVGEQLLDVLAAAHEKQIVHRDIKPDNLFITQEGRLKVLDFGFAQMRSGFRAEQTATGFLLGTPGFMSPEQAIGNRPQVDAQTDIWAVGATLFTLISGEPVHAGESAAEMLVAAANFPPRSLATVMPGLNPRLVALVDRALAFEKSQRWPNARAMQAALREVSGKQTGGQVSRRSIPDDQATLHEDTAMEIEELDASELVDARTGSWGSTAQADRTVVAQGHSVPEEAIASAITRPGETRARAHPADDDGPTLAVPASTTDPSELAPMTSAPHTPQMAPYPSGGAVHAGMVDPSLDGGTLIMESPAAREEPGASGAYPQILGPSTSPTPFGSQQPFPAPLSTQPLPPVQAVQNQRLQQQQQLQQQLYPQDPRPRMGSDPQLDDMRSDPQLSNRGDDMMYVARPPQRAMRAPEPGSSRVLVFIAVAVCTMVVVIVAGLILLAASD